MRDGREEFLEAARRRFLESGMEGVSLSDIAAEIGMDIETVHQYFPEKLALIFIILKDELTLVAQKTMETLPASKIDDQLRHLLKYRFEFFVTHQHSSSQVMREVLFSNKGWGEIYDTMLWRFSIGIVALFQAAKRRGEVRSDADETLAGRAFVSYYLSGVLMILHGEISDTESICDFTFPLVDSLVDSLQ